jgi:hypothetical protein
VEVGEIIPLKGKINTHSRFFFSHLMKSEIRLLLYVDRKNIFRVIELRKYIVGLFALFLIFSLGACSSEGSKTTKAEVKN